MKMETGRLDRSQSQDADDMKLGKAHQRRRAESREQRSLGGAEVMKMETEDPDRSQSRSQVSIATPAALMALLNRLADTAVAREQRRQLAHCRDVRRTRLLSARPLELAGPTADCRVDHEEREATEECRAACGLSWVPFSEELDARMRQVLTGKECSLLWLRATFGISWRCLGWFFGTTAAAIRGRHYRICQRLRRYLRSYWETRGGQRMIQ